MSDKPTGATPQAESAQEMERIRDIIFGAQMRDYERQFQTIQRDLERLQRDIDRLSQQLTDQESSQSKKIQGLRQEMRQADDDLREELRQTAQTLTTDKVDRVALGGLFVELGTRLKTGASLTDLLENISEEEQG